MRSFVLAALFSTVLAGPVLANPIDTGSFSYGSYTVTNDINVYVSAGAVQGTYGAGQINLVGTGANKGTTLATWCLDIYDLLASSGTFALATTALNDHGGDKKGTTISTATLGQIGALIAYGTANISAQYVSSSVQLAIWTVEYDIGEGLNYTFTSSNSKVNALVKTLVAEVTGSTPVLAPNYAVKELVSVDRSGHATDQGQVFLAPTSPVPEPATLALIGTGLLGLAAVRRRKAL